jgi:hypothetical protein
MTERCNPGDWVEVEYLLLAPEDRAANLPEDTAAQPLRAWVKGYAQSSAVTGDELVVTTMTGRHVTGILTEVNPGYTHTFGRPAPELTHVGFDLRERVAAYRASAAAKAGE